MGKEIITTRVIIFVTYAREQEKGKMAYLVYFAKA
jgi:hypothetical protein